MSLCAVRTESMQAPDTLSLSINNEALRLNVASAAVCAVNNMYAAILSAKTQGMEDGV